MKRLVFTSTLHDPNGALTKVLDTQRFQSNLNYVFKGLDELGYDPFFVISATSATNDCLLDRLMSFRANVYQIPNNLNLSIEDNHVRALNLGLNYASNKDLIHYIDGDRLIHAMFFFPSDIIEMFEVATREMQKFPYLGHIRTKEAFETHTKPMILTEMWITACYSMALQRIYDPCSTAHTFVPKSIEYILENNDKFR